MKIVQEFSVDVSPAAAWPVLTDLPQVAECLPGAQYLRQDGDDHHGRIKVRIGPITSEFTGTAHFTELDDTAHRAVIEARGRDVRGAGNASAVIETQLHDDGAGRTRVTVDTDLRIVGKLAQFGSGVIQDISTVLMADFAGRLQERLVTQTDTVPSPDPGTDDPVRDPVDDAPEYADSAVEPVALGGIAAAALGRRLLPVVLIAAVIVIGWLIVR